MLHIGNELRRDTYGNTYKTLSLRDCLEQPGVRIGTIGTEQPNRGTRGPKFITRTCFCIPLNITDEVSLSKRESLLRYRAGRVGTSKEFDTKDPSLFKLTSERDLCLTPVRRRSHPKMYKQLQTQKPRQR